MPAKTAKKAKTARAAETVSTVETLKQAFTNFTGKLEMPKLEMPGSARDFVKRSAVTASEKAAEAHDFAQSAAGKTEQAITAIVNGGAKITRNVMQASFENLEAVLVNVQKTAEAKSLSEAAQLQADFIRDYTKANFNRLRSAADAVRETSAENAAMLQAEFAKYNPFMKKAA